MYDVVVIGSGPAGVFAARELGPQSSGPMTGANQALSYVVFTRDARELSAASSSGGAGGSAA